MCPSPTKKRSRPIRPEVDGYAWSEVLPMTRTCLEAGLSVLLRGHPGVGKSALAAELASQMQLPMGQGGGELDIDVPGVMDHGGGIDVHLPVDLSEAEREELRDRVTAAVHCAEAAAHRGDVPGELVREVRARGRSVVPWQRLLHRLVGEALPATEYSLSRPNRRYLAEDLLVPGLVGDGPERVVVAIDSSGSMSGETLTAACTELAALSHRVGEITVLIADAKVQRVIRPAELPEFLRQTRLPGGGGTSHEPVFAWIASQPWRPDLFVGLTDLFSSFPTAKPNYPVLWIAPKKHGKAPWGAVVEVHSDRLDP